MSSLKTPAFGLGFEEWAAGCVREKEEKVRVAEATTGKDLEMGRG